MECLSKNAGNGGERYRIGKGARDMVEKQSSETRRLVHALERRQLNKKRPTVRARVYLI